MKLSGLNLVRLTEAPVDLALNSERMIWKEKSWASKILMVLRLVETKQLRHLVEKRVWQIQTAENLVQKMQMASHSVDLMQMDYYLVGHWEHPILTALHLVLPMQKVSHWAVTTQKVQKMQLASHSAGLMQMDYYLAAHWEHPILTALHLVLPIQKVSHWVETTLTVHQRPRALYSLSADLMQMD